MMQSVTRRKRLSYTRRWCIVIATSFISVYLWRAFKHHEHRGRAAVLFLRAFSPRESLICGPNPRRSGKPFIILTFITRWRKDFSMRSTRAEKRAEKPGSICPPPALPRLVNILHAVGADRVLRKGPVGPVPCHHDVAATITFERVAEETRSAHAKTKKWLHTAPTRVHRLARPVIYFLIQGSSEDFIAKLCSRCVQRWAHEICNMSKKSIFPNNVGRGAGALFSITSFLSLL